MGSKKEKPWVKVFVYGTLMTGCALHDWLADERFARKIGDGTIDGFSLLSLGPYPALIKIEGFEGGVVGELWELDPYLFSELRKMEERVGYSTEEVHVYVPDVQVNGIAAQAFIFSKIEETYVKWNVTKKNPKPEQQIIEVKG